MLYTCFYSIQIWLNQLSIAMGGARGISNCRICPNFHQNLRIIYKIIYKINWDIMLRYNVLLKDVYKKKTSQSFKFRLRLIFVRVCVGGIKGGELSV